MQIAKANIGTIKFPWEQVRKDRDTVKYSANKTRKPRKNDIKPRRGWGNPEIKYDWDSLVLGEPTPIVAKVSENDNTGGGTETQETRLTFSTSVSEGKHFENELHAQISYGAEVSAGIPGIVDVSGNVQTTLGVSGKWGETYTTKDTVSVATIVKAAAGEHILAKAVLTQQIFTLYFTVTTSHIDQNKKREVLKLWDKYSEANLEAMKAKAVVMALEAQWFVPQWVIDGKKKPNGEHAKK